MHISVTRPNSTQRKEYGKLGDGGRGSMEKGRKEVCGVKEKGGVRSREKERSAGLPCEHMLGRTLDSLRKKCAALHSC